ncbi:MAG TPA: hypothetical protein VEU50_01305, partial [Archangium sp.]|nr:hypothetical protein [Archangium sp.]
MQTPLTTTVPETAEAPVLRAVRSAQPRWAPYLFLAPFLAWFATFALFPLLFTLFLSFHNWEAASGMERMKFAVWSNYQFNLTDPWFWNSLWNTLWLAMVSGLPQHL